MSGKTAVRKRDAIRKLLHIQRESPPVSPSPPSPSCPPSANRVSTPTQVPSAPSVNAPSSSPFTQKVYQEALLALSPEQLEGFKPYANPNDLTVNALDEAHAAVLKLQQSCEDKAWKVKFRGKEYPVRDVANKLLVWLNKLKVVGDAVAGIDPVHIGLPWKAFCLLSEFAVSHHSEMEALVKGLDLALCTATRLQAYLGYLERLPAATTTTTQFERAVTELYSHVLGFIATAICVYRGNALSRVWQALWNISEIEAFEDRCNEMGSEIEINAHVCDRELTHQDREHMTQWKTELDNKLADIRVVEKSLEVLNDKVDQIQAKVEATQLNTILAKLETAKGAMHDSYLEPDQTQCLHGTRTELLCQINDWADDPDAKRIFWLCGKAGTGKCTISRTIAHNLDNSNPTTLRARLGASFFFKRRGGDRGNATRFFPTIAYQLAEKDSKICSAIANAVNSNFDLCNKSLEKQFELLFQPLMDPMLFATNRSILVVILDALDECDNQGDIQRILELLAKVETLGGFQVHILITSRPEVPIQLKLERLQKGGIVYHDMKLEEAQSDTIEQDIRTYLIHHLQEIKEDDDDLPDAWPELESVEALVKLACPLFIFAATACRYISGHSSKRDNVLGSHPQTRLEYILRLKSPLSSLDAVYEAILDQVFPAEVDTLDYEDEQDEFRQFLSPLALLYSPLPLTSLSRLLGLPTSSVLRMLKRLQSVLQVPSSATDPSLIRPLHASFPDYLLRENKKSGRFRVDIAETHADLANHCLRRLEDILRPDICKVTHPGTRRIELNTDQVNHSIPADVAYACCYWVHHQRKDHKRLSDNDRVYNFLRRHFLHWLEALSWLGRLSDVIVLIEDLRSLVNNTSPTKENDWKLSSLMHRASYLINRYVVDLAPLQLYLSALHFTPRQSVVRTEFESSLTIAQHFDLVPEPPLSWTSELQKLEGHKDDVLAVMFSPDGKLIASGSGDHTIRLWDAQTGEEQRTLVGHDNMPVMLTFSSDGTMIASAAWSDSVRVWSVRTGQQIHIFGPPGERLAGIAFSPIGEPLALYPGERIMNLTTGEMLKLEAIRGQMDASAVSPDGRVMVTALWNTSIYRWDTHTGELLKSFKGHDRCYNSVVISSDDQKLIAMTSYGTTLSSPNGGEIGCGFRSRKNQERGTSSSDWAPDKGPGSGMRFPWVDSPEGSTWVDWATDEKPCSGMISAVAVSPEGRTVILVLDGGKLELRDDGSGQVLVSFEGHDDVITTATFSSGKELVISASRDRTIRLWNTWTGEEVHKLSGFDKDISAVAYSSPGKMVAFASQGEVVQLHNTEAGAERRTLKGHRGSVHALCFAPDGQLLASTAWDETVRIWEVSTRKEILKLELEEPWVGAAFNSDGKTIITASGTGKVRLWNLESGQSSDEVQVQDGCDTKFTSAAISWDNEMVALATSEQTVRLKSLRTGKELQHLRGCPQTVTSMSFSPDGRLLATTSIDDVTILLWDTRTGKIIQSLQAHDDRMCALAFSPDGTVLASGSCDRTVRLWNTQMDRMVSEEDEYHRLGAVQFSLKGHAPISLSSDTVRVWNAHTGAEAIKLGVPGIATWSIVTSPGGNVLAATDSDRTMRLWDVETGIVLHILEDLPGGSALVAFSRDGRLVASLRKADTGISSVWIWNTHPGGEQGTKLDVNGDGMFYGNTMVFSPDSSILAITARSGLNGLLVLLDTATGRRVQRIPLAGPYEENFAFSPDGKSVITSCSVDEPVRIWSVQTGVKMLELAQTGFGGAVAFALDGEKVACLGTGPWEICLWDVCTGLRILTIKTTNRVESFRLDTGNRLLHTNVGTFELLDEVTSSTGTLRARSILELNGAWIRHRGRDLLWLPQEYRGRSSNVHGNTIMIGQVSGAVSFFRLREDVSVQSN